LNGSHRAGSCTSSKRKKNEAEGYRERTEGIGKKKEKRGKKKRLMAVKAYL